MAKLPMAETRIKDIIRKNYLVIPSTQIAKMIGVSRTTIWRFKNELGVGGVINGRLPRPKKEDIQRRVEWVRECGGRKTILEIAEGLKISVDAVRKMINTYDLQVMIVDGNLAEDRTQGPYFNVHSRENWLI